MNLKPQDSIADFDIEQIELKGFSRSIAEIEWLLLLLVILYYVSFKSEIVEPLGVLISIEVFMAFVLGFHYINYDAPQYRWKLILETWVMMAFITWVLWNTGKIDSPLLNLYFLVIIASAIALGKVVTFLEIALVGCFYFFLAAKSGVSFEVTDFANLMTFFGPFVLVAYVTTMLASDVNYGRRMFKSLAETDEMTKLLNRRSFRPLFNKAADHAVQYSQPLTVLMIDADNLKEINDTHGHKAGDKLIVSIANNIQECLRTSDIICRYGGDEFVALLPKTPADQVYDAAERVRFAIESSYFYVGKEKVYSTVSIGIATYPTDVGNVYSLLEKADEMLYESKMSGRNKVVSTVESKQSDLQFPVGG